MISLVINGKDVELQGPTPLPEYLKEKGFAGRQIAVAVNGEVVAREQHDSVVLNDGDRVEIVRPVGGG
jgi:sulfur carrier protein